jgi:sec-independent protein translocase protein TatA
MLDMRNQTKIAVFTRTFYQQILQQAVIMKEILMDFGAPELIFVLVIVILLFGPNRIGKVAGELGKGIRDFRNGLSGKDEKMEQESNVQEPPSA